MVYAIGPPREDGGPDMDTWTVIFDYLSCITPAIRNTGDTGLAEITPRSDKNMLL